MPEDADALPIRSHARVLGATLRVGARLEHDLKGLRYAYAAPSRGVVEINGRAIAEGDGIAAVDELHLTIVARTDVDLILVETV
jgi:redox-sensitive bicupin YhaK (pirin superfamily)